MQDSSFDAYEKFPDVGNVARCQRQLANTAVTFVAQVLEAHNSLEAPGGVYEMARNGAIKFSRLARSQSFLDLQQAVEALVASEPDKSADALAEVAAKAESFSKFTNNPRAEVFDFARKYWELHGGGFQRASYIIPYYQRQLDKAVLDYRQAEMMPCRHGMVRQRYAAAEGSLLAPR